MEIPTPTDGIHLTWQYCQNTKPAQEELSVPFCALVELLAPVEGMHVLQYPPSLCGSCKSALNCYCEVDYDRQMWRCPICGTVQQLPGHYRGITEQHLPAELFSGCNVVEHELPPTSQAIKPPIVLFLLDMCITEEDMASMKQTIERALSSLPESTRIGIITFGSMVYLHNLTSSTIATCTVYRGTTAITKRDIGVKSRHSQSRAAIGGPGAAGANETPFLVPLTDCDFAVDRVLEGMIPEASKAGERHQRCTGAALAVAVSLLETAAYTESGRIMLLTGGPATVGPGAIVGVDYAEPLRTHKDLDKGSAKHFSVSATFYDALAHRLIENGQALDIFACALDQTGVAEMEHLAICTGGLLTIAEHFGHNVFQNSFMSLLQPAAVPSGADGASLDEVLPWHLNGMLEVSPAKNLGISGAVGPIASLEKKSAACVEPQIGLGATTAWKLNATRLTYQHPSGVKRMRVATRATYWADPSTNPQGMGFSANTSAIVYARWLAYEASRGASARELSTWLDRQLVALTQRAASFKEGDTDSVVLPGELSAFPELVFHIRRSTFLNYFGNAPDETVFYRSLLFREGHESCALMLRPRLQSFPVDGSGAQDLPLDIAAIPVDAVAVLDSWYTVIVHTGSHLASWVKQGLLENPDYEHVKEGYEKAHQYANHLVATRLPQPRLVVCDQGTSQARFLLARLNPSQTQQNTDGQDVGAVIFTDDVSFDVFMEQLRKLIVGKNS